MASIVTPRVCLKVIGATGVGRAIENPGPASFNPYCQARCGEVVLRTEAKEKTSNPTWNQDFKFGVRKPLGEEISFKVFGYQELVKDMFLGQTELKIAELTPNIWTKHTLILKLNESDLHGCGELIVEATYEPEFVKPAERATSSTSSTITTSTTTTTATTSTSSALPPLSPRREVVATSTRPKTTVTTVQSAPTEPASTTDVVTEETVTPDGNRVKTIRTTTRTTRGGDDSTTTTTTTGGSTTFTTSASTSTSGSTMTSMVQGGTVTTESASLVTGAGKRSSSEGAVTTTTSDDDATIITTKLDDGSMTETTVLEGGEAVLSVAGDSEKTTSISSDVDAGTTTTTTTTSADMGGETTTTVVEKTTTTTTEEEIVDAAATTTSRSDTTTTTTSANTGGTTGNFRSDSSSSSIASPLSTSIPSTTTSAANLPQPNYLVVTILEAKGLQAMDGSGMEATSDPFVKVHCTNNQSQRTRTQQQTLHPRWRQKFYFYLAPGSLQVLELVVEDQDMISNDFLGRCIINLEEWKAHFQSSKQVFWLALEHKEQSGATAYSDISSERKMNYGRGKICIALEMQYMDRKMSTLEQGELDHDTVIPTGKGLKNTGPTANNNEEGGEEENIQAGGDADVAGSDDNDDEDSDDDDDNEDDDDALKKETEEEKKEREDERARMMAELSNVEFKSGDYQIRVRIIEVRDLVPMDVNGSCDPVVAVECLGQRQHTSVKQKQLSCIFDEYLYFNFKHLDKDAVEQGSIKVSVLDADGPSVLSRRTRRSGYMDDLIGFFVVDLPYVYFKPNHQIHRKWVALVGNGKNNSDCILGYLLLSIVVLGPGDKLMMHDIADDNEVEGQNVTSKNDINSLVLIPPRVTQTLNYLVVTVHRAEELPDMDQSMMKQGGCDGYVRAYFAGQDVLETKKVTAKGGGNLMLEFNQELWFPIKLPTMSNNIFISVWDWDMTADELVANIVKPFQFNQIQKYPNQFKLFYANLYGPPLGYVMDSEERRYMHDHPALASTYRGRVLLSMRVEGNSKSVNDRAHTRNLMRIPSLPPTKRYILRAALFYGTEIPKFASKTAWNRNSRMGVRISIGKHSIKTARVDNVSGICHWNQYLDIPDLAFPEQLDQMPDIFVHLVRRQMTELRPICYARFNAKDLFYDSNNIHELKTIPSPQWVVLKEDPVLDDLKDHDFTGNILMNLRIEPMQTHEAVEREIARKWRDHSSTTVAYMKYTLFIHIFQGRCLPASDSNGALDSYVKVSCAGAEGKVATRMGTRDPCYYETVTLDVELPQNQIFLPKVSLQVYDWDQFDADDYVGSLKFSLTDFPQMSSTEYNSRRANGEYLAPRPKWYPICYQTEGDTEGELLLSFDLIKKDTPGVILEPPESIHPPTEEKFVEIICLGCRGLQPVNFMPVNTPFVKFEIGEMTKTNQPKFTNSSSKPSGRNPNFLERVVIPVKMPLDALFAPRLNISVYDRLLGGYYKPLLGLCAVDLSTKMQFSNGEPNPLYVESGVKTTFWNPYVDHPDDFSTYPGTIPTKIKEKALADIKEDKAEDKANEIAAADAGVGVFPLSFSRSGYSSVTESDYEDDLPHYMHDREVMDCALEEVLPTPFETFSLFRGEMLMRRHPFSQPTEVDYRSVGKFKGMIRVLKSRDEPPLFDLDQFLNPHPYLIRVYVLDAMNIQPKDDSNKADPYLRLSLGDGRKRSTMFNDRENFKRETLTPKFHKMFEFKTELPGASELRVEVLDHDFFAIPAIPHGLSKGLVSVGTTVDGDDFIGATLIDLEDRWFSQKWHELGAHPDRYERRKPLEIRPLYAPSSTLAQGNIRLWVDILTPPEIKLVKPLDISLPPMEHFEVRVIIYKARNVIPGDFTDLTDLVVKCWLQNNDDKAQYTDTHWRAKYGKASFNWRMKFDIDLPIDPDSEADKGYLHFQLWDKDVLYDDCLADTVVDLSMFLKQAYKTKKIVNVFGKSKPVRMRGPSIHSGRASSEKPMALYSTSSIMDSSKSNFYSASSMAESFQQTQPPTSGNSEIFLNVDTESDVTRPLLSSMSSSGSTVVDPVTGQRKKKENIPESIESKENAESLVRSIKQRLGMGDDPEDSSWLTCATRDPATGDRVCAGELLVSVEILPIAVAHARAAGLGRSEPNNFPFLPEPADRLHLSAMWNPFFVLEAVIGPKFYRAFASCFVFAFLIAMLILAGPILNVMLELLELVPPPYGIITFGVLVVLFLLSIFYINYRCRRAFKTSHFDDEGDK